MTKRRQFPMHSHVFKGVIEGYLVNQIHANAWRFKNVMGVEDALQEGYIMFAHNAELYPDVEPAHFMALYKTTLERRIIDWSRKSTDACHVSLNDAEGNSLDVAGDVENDGYLSVLIKQAPAEVTQVLTLFLNAPTELLQLAMASWRSTGKIDAGGNRQVAQWLGLPAGSKPLDKVLEYFGD